MSWDLEHPRPERGTDLNLIAPIIDAIWPEGPCEPGRRVLAWAALDLRRTVRVIVADRRSPVKSLAWAIAYFVAGLRTLAERAEENGDERQAAAIDRERDRIIAALRSCGARGAALLRDADRMDGANVLGGLEPPW